MLYWALVFAVIALVAGVFGFGGVASAAASVARILFFIFIVIFLITLVAALLYAWEHATPFASPALGHAKRNARSRGAATGVLFDRRRGGVWGGGCDRTAS
jgi:uncharacterized membrane protein YtjA (UPF0391 family)